MTKLGNLLDTSTIIWMVADPKQVSKAADAALDEPAYVSVISFWEIVQKARVGKLQFADPVRWWADAIEALAATVLPVTSHHVTTLYTLPQHHKDPFDRMLIAQAISEGIGIVTSDRAIAKYPVEVIW